MPNQDDVIQILRAAALKVEALEMLQHEELLLYLRL